MGWPMRMVWTRRWTILTALAFVVLSAGVNLRYAHDKFIPTDDSLLMYLTNRVLDPATDIDAQLQPALEHLATGPYDPAVLRHFEFRDGNISNYLLHSAAYFLTRLALPAPDPASYADHVYTVLKYGSHAAHWVVLLLTVVILARLRDPRHLAAALIASCAMILITATGMVPRPHWRIGAYADPLEYLWAVSMFFIDTGGGWSPYGTAGRAAFTMLLFAVFPLRWSGNLAAAYWLVVASCFTHQTYAGIVVIALLCIDAVIRPRQLLDWRVLLPAALTLALFLWRESLWRVFADWWLPVGLLGCVALLVGVSWLLGRWPALARVTGAARLRAMSPLGSDLWLLAAGMAALLLLSWGMSRLDDSETALFVWQEMAARPLALVKIPLVCGLIWLVLDRLERAGTAGPALLRLGLAGTVAIALLGGVAQGVAVARTSGADNATARYFVETAQGKFERLLADPTLKLDEEAIYYALNRQIDLGDGSLDRLVSSRQLAPGSASGG